MNKIKEIWKWIFLHKSDKEIEEMVKNTEIKIPGFRPGVIPKNSKKLIASTIATNLNMKKLELLKYEPQSKIAEKYNLKDMSVSELHDIDDLPLEMILSYLLTNERKSDAEEFFETMITKYTNDEIETIEENRKKIFNLNFNENQGIEINEKENSNNKQDNKKVMKMEAKLVKTNNLYNNLQEEYIKYKLETKEQIKLMNSETNKINQCLIKLQKEMQKKEDQIILYEKEKMELLMIHNKKEEEMKKESNILIEKNKMSEKLLSDFKRDVRLDKVESDEKKKNDKKILLIGNPFNKKILQDININVDFIEKFEIESTNLNIYEEIIFLSYRVDVAVYTKLIKSNYNIKKVDNFIDLKKELLKYKI